MAVSDFRIVQTTSNLSTRISGSKTIATLKNINSRNRHTFSDGLAGLAAVIHEALTISDSNWIVYGEYVSAGLDVLVTKDDCKQIAGDLDVYDILREYTGGASVKPVKDRTISACGTARAQVIGEYWPVDSKGKSHLRGIQVAYWIDGFEDDPDYYDFACDKNGHISPKSYGIGALWDLAKPQLEEHAKDFAMACRTRTNMYTRTRYSLEKLVEGIAVRK
jgi:hypothetical protein